MPASEYQALMKTISSIHEAIQSIDEFDFANPHSITDLPFPSPLRIPTQRFTNASKDDDSEDDNEDDSEGDSDDDNHHDNDDHNTGGRIQTFRYMGRTLFQKLLKGARDSRIYSQRFAGSLPLWRLWGGQIPPTRGPSLPSHPEREASHVYP